MKYRPRRNRRTETIRSLVRETELSVNHLVAPLFLVDGKGVKDGIASLPGQFRFSEDQVIKEISECVDLGINSFILFPVVEEKLKDPYGKYGIDPGNFYLRIAKAIKRDFPDVCLISDVALDPYSSDGHDGLVKDGEVLNDETLPILAEMSVLQAGAGFDFIGPSDMMDGRVGAIRSALDDEGFETTGIISYTAKYASAFYGPFRDALDSAPKEGDKKTYQMDPANIGEAGTEAALDEMEGADILMVKPAVHYLDVIQRLKSLGSLPIAAYHVSGECAMLLAAVRNGWLEYEMAMPETLLSIRRAGADIIISYFAKDFARLKKSGL